uniref:Uncharacterized protein n=1 Tax=Oryza nivara TaxID=4536 RepID=A0A0E0IFW7_ORYNI
MFEPALSAAWCVADALLLSRTRPAGCPTQGRERERPEAHARPVAGSGEERRLARSVGPPHPPRPATSSPPAGQPAQEERSEREREEEGRGGERGRVMTWHPNMWGSCGSHADLAVTSDKTTVKTTKGHNLSKMDGVDRDTAARLTIRQRQRVLQRAMVMSEASSD